MKTKIKNSWDWVNSLFSKEIDEITEGKHPDTPFQVEIHPHHSSTELCNNNCNGCTGGGYRNSESKKQGIDINRFIETIDSFKGKTRRVVFAGNCTEPLLYPEINTLIRHIRDAGLEFGLYSNFYYADKPGFLEELTNTSLNDYVRVSLDAGTSESYNKTHNPKDKNSFEKIKENTEDLLTLNKNLDIHITYLLSDSNCNKTDLKAVTEWVGKHEGINSMRFHVYQKPLGRNMPNSSIISPSRLEETRELLSELKEQYKDNFNMKIAFPKKMILNQKEKPFERCYVQHIFAVIGFDGEVYPCTAMASPSSSDIYKFGNINYEKFWDIWKNIDKKSLFPLDKCYDCTRAEFDVNCHVQELVNQKVGEVEPCLA